MSTLWKTLKIFVSSTFLDLELARDKLAQIFHETEKNFLSRQLTLRLYDLRWRDRHSSDPIVDWCIEHVKNCQYFIGILGNRYGWRPPQGAYGAENTNNISITEMEINCALENIDPQRRFFCFGKSFVEQPESAEDIASLEALKQRLIAAGEKVYNYESVEGLLYIISSNFTQTVDAEFPAENKVEPVKFTFKQALEEIIAEKVRGFVGRDSYLHQLQQFSQQNKTPNYLGIHAIAGTGKSALLAKFIHAERQNSSIIAHYPSMGGGSNTVDGLIDSIAEQLLELQILQAPLALDTKLKRLQILDALAETEQKLILVLDGLDEIKDNQNLSWLWRDLPDNIRVIVSTRPVEIWDSLKTHPHLQALELPPLEEKEITDIIRGYTQKHDLQLSSNDIELLQKRAVGNPLFLKVALDEIVASGIAVGQLAMSVEALFDQIIQRLEELYEKSWIDQYLGYIAASRSGITEKDLAEMLGIGDDKLLQVNRALSNFIVMRNGLLGFFHPEFERTVMMRIGKQSMRTHHQNFAQFLQKKGYAYIRTLEELPHQLQWAECYHDVLQTLSDIEFIEAKCSVVTVYDLLRDFQFATEQGAVQIPAHVKVEKCPNVVVDKETLLLLYQALEKDIHFISNQPHSVFQFLWNVCYWHDCEELKDHYQDGSTFANSKIHLLMEHWRDYQEKHQSVWLKSLRPLPYQLNSSLLKTLRGHTEAIERVRYSPDGKTVVSGAWDGIAYLWNVENGEIVRRFQTSSRIFGVAISNDGNMIATGCYNGEVDIWDRQSGEKICALKHPKSTPGLAFSPDGKYLATGSKDGKVRIWDISQKELLHTIEGHQGGIWCIAYSPDGAMIASGSHDSVIGIWNPNTGEKLHTLTQHEGMVHSVTFHPNSQILASGSYDKTARLWNAQSGELLRTFHGHEDRVYSVDISSDGTKLLTGGVDKVIRIWDIESGDLIQAISGHENNAICTKFSPDATKVASAGGFDKMIRIWDVATAKQQNQLKGHTKTILDLKITSDGKRVVSAAEDNVLCLWDAMTGQLQKVLTGHTNRVSSVVFTPDNTHVISGGHDKEIRIWNCDSGEMVHSWQAHQNLIHCIDITTDGNRLASCSSDKVVKIWDLTTYELLHCFEDLKIVNRVIFSPDTKMIAAVEKNGILHIWNTETYDKIQCISGIDYKPHSVSFSADGKKLFSSNNRDNILQIWDVSSGACLETIHEAGTTEAFMDDEQPYWGSIQPWKISVKKKQNHQEIASFPGSFRKCVFSHQQRIALCAGMDVYILQLT